MKGRKGKEDCCWVVIVMERKEAIDVDDYLGFTVQETQEI